MKPIHRSIRCTTCHDDFRYTIRVTEELLQAKLRLQLSCPFCYAKLRVDLEPYQQGGTELFRNTDAPSDSSTMPTLNLPDELPSSLRENT